MHADCICYSSVTVVTTIKNVNLPVVRALQYLRYYYFTINNSENLKAAGELSVVHGGK